MPCQDFWWTTTFSEPVVTGNFTGPSGLPGHVRHEPCRAIPLRAADEVQLMARRSALKMHVLEVGAAEDWALDDPVNRLFPTSKHVEYDWNDEPIENTLWRLAWMFCMGSFAVCCFSDNKTIQKRKPKTKNGRHRICFHQNRSTKYKPTRWARQARRCGNRRLKCPRLKFRKICQTWRYHMRQRSWKTVVSQKHKAPRPDTILDLTPGSFVLYRYTSHTILRTTNV